MGRGANRATGAATLTTTQARRDLPKLAREAARQAKPGKSLTERAIRIQPQGEERAAYLVAEVDLVETLDRIADLEELLEDMEFISILEQRTGGGDDPPGQPLTEVIQEFAQEGLLSDADIASIEAVGAEPA